MAILVTILILLANVSHAFPKYLSNTDFIGFPGIHDTTLTNTNTDSTDSTNKNTIHKIIPLNYDYSLYNLNALISQKEKQFKDYRFSGDLLNYLPFGYLLDLGWMGQPSEVVLYNLGFNNITFLNDGINYNNRLTNSLDLNFIQTENLDLIGVAPLPRGFLFGNLNNPVSVIFLNNDSPVTKPYTKIRFYQAKNEEAYINGVFKTRLFRKLYGILEFTNNTIDNGYQNTEFSSWQVNSTLKYLASANLNFTLRYNHVRSYTGLFGGVNYDSIKAMPNITNPDDVLYNRILAPVEFKNRYKKITSHNFELETLIRLSGNSLSKVNVYYQFRSLKFRQNEYSKEQYVKRIFNDDDYDTYGISFFHKQSFGILSAELFGNYERVNNKIVKYGKGYSNYDKKTYFNYGLILSANLLDGNLIPSIFAKQLNTDINNKNYPGIGADATLKLWNRSSLYFGYSKYSKPLHIFPTLLNDAADVNTFEMKLMFDFARLNGSIRYFSYLTTKSLNLIFTVSDDFLKTVEFIDFSIKDNLTNSGIGLNLNYHTWKILTELNVAYYFKNEHPDSKYSLFAGVYYVDTLFQNNLHLKAGFNFKSSAIQSNIIYDFEKQLSTLINRTQVGNSSTLLIPDYSSTITNQLDIFVAGEIQEAATVYFVLENVFDTKYYIIKYFPKQEMTFRFGFSWEFLN